MTTSLFLTDIGLNLASAQFARDRTEVLARGRAAGVGRFILTGVTLQSSDESAALCEHLGGPNDCYYTAGVHPHYANTLDKAGLERLRRLLRHPRAVAVGETGLDYFRDLSPRAVQRKGFEAQIAIAIESGKPLFLHERQAHDDFLAVLDSFGQQLPASVVHCFTGDEVEAARYIERDFYLGITGWVGQRKRNAALLRALKVIPLDRILLETDAPYLMPDAYVPPQPRRNEPAAMLLVAQLVADAKKVPVGELVAQVEENTCRFFQFG